MLPRTQGDDIREEHDPQGGPWHAQEEVSVLAQRRPGEELGGQYGAHRDLVQECHDREPLGREVPEPAGTEHDQAEHDERCASPHVDPDMFLLLRGKQEMRCHHDDADPDQHPRDPPESTVAVALYLGQKAAKS